MNIDTPRTRLRPLGPDDVEDLVHLDGDPEVMRYVSAGVPTSRAVIEEWVLPRAEAERVAHGTGMWSIVDPASSSFLGWVSLRTPRHSNRTELELSYRLRRAAWGRGLATEASRAVLAFAFGHLGTERVFAGTMAINVGSRRVMEKLGMSLAAIHVSDERFDELSPPPSVLGFLADGGFDQAEVEYEIVRAQWTFFTSRWSGSTDLTA
ncbi:MULTISPECIES: GNAT family N-acetyltransferase [unclassified Gordonia (in: high G+C Gram-positive bacteria)]|uniref:GNAT family N-acetyltransferase n=1 Tax=unclassified Gordonia (in: high G+C Gram-positive bacteria) TaxID=2657482 RepID=UPI001F0F30E4|nr:GNAT family N-acetyltransferase [Gordonia sp. ABSL49_1]MCH5642646.1 GNAT family N-acetyltransferase [Gordonia sp. ABSL49_1]